MERFGGFFGFTESRHGFFLGFFVLLLLLALRERPRWETRPRQLEGAGRAEGTLEVYGLFWGA